MRQQQMCKLGCQTAAYPFLEFYYSQKGEYQFCSEQCVKGTSEEFLNALSDYQKCQNSSAQYYPCNNEYAVNAPDQPDAFCQRSYILLCNSSQYPAEFTSYLNCLGQCKKQSYAHKLLIREVKECQNEFQCRNCPSQDALCEKNLFDANACQKSDAHKECVIGKQKLAVLSQDDPYPVEMKQCTELCRSAEPLSSFYTLYQYNQQHSCEEYSVPRFDVPLTSKKQYLNCAS